MGPGVPCSVVMGCKKGASTSKREILMYVHLLSQLCLLYWQ